jgi:hypothetical protein
MKILPFWVTIRRPLPRGRPARYTAGLVSYFPAQTQLQPSDHQGATGITRDDTNAYRCCCWDSIRHKCPPWTQAGKYPMMPPEWSTWIAATRESRSFKLTTRRGSRGRRRSRPDIPQQTASLAAVTSFETGTTGVKGFDALLGTRAAEKLDEGRRIVADVRCPAVRLIEPVDRHVCRREPEHLGHPRLSTTSVSCYDR